MQKNIDIHIASQETVDIHESIVNEIMASIGFSQALVTDETQFSDFSFMDKETEDLIVSIINQQFKVFINIQDTVADTAIKIYHQRKENKERKLLH